MQRYFALGIENNKVFVTKDDEHHIKRVMRMKVNDEIEVVFDHQLYRATITDIDNLTIETKELLDSPKLKGPLITLIIPTLKEQKMDYIFQKGTELGVNEFIVVPFERSIVRYDERKEKVKLERWQKICKEASEQSRRIEIPIISIKKDMHFVDTLDGLKLLCSTNEKDNYIKYVLKNNNGCDKLIIVIGPEGGISLQEELFLESKGFTKITLGSQIMRVETVPLFLTSVIRYEYME